MASTSSSDLDFSLLVFSLWFMTVFIKPRPARRLHSGRTFLQQWVRDNRNDCNAGGCKWAIKAMDRGGAAWDALQNLLHFHINLLKRTFLAAKFSCGAVHLRSQRACGICGLIVWGDFFSLLVEGGGWNLMSSPLTHPSLPLPPTLPLSPSLFCSCPQIEKIMTLIGAGIDFSRDQQYSTPGRVCPWMTHLFLVRIF